MGPVADIFDEEKRSEIMSRITSSGTKPEERLYAIVRSILGHRWRIDTNVRELPGKPDILIPTLSLVLFSDGCFFHRCPEHGRIPDTNQEYWEPKLKNNVERDRNNRAELRRRGFTVWRFWGHDLKTKENLAETQSRLEEKLNGRLKAWRDAGKPRRL